MDKIIIVPDMPYMRDIFAILRTGAFISEDCFSESNRRYYRKIDDNFDAYFKYFLQLGYYLERGDGYVHLTEARPAFNVQSKMRTDIGKYIQMLAVLIKFRPELAPGYQFRSSDLTKFFDENDDMLSVLPTSDDNLLPSRVATFLRNVSREGFLDISSDESTCMVTSAFKYLKQYVTTIKLYGEHAKFNLEGEKQVEAPSQDSMNNDTTADGSLEISEE
jgi:hypothetical protein